jgi:putative tryptophan/tyrosine transport system substrate-binding protein
LAIGAKLPRPSSTLRRRHERTNFCGARRKSDNLKRSKSSRTGKPMRRRDFITVVGGAAASWPLTTRAQEAGRTYRLGNLSPAPRAAPFFDGFFDELRRNGFVEGQNLVDDAHGYGMRDEQFAEHAAELVKAQVDVITAAGDVAVRAAQQATKTIPILASGSDLVRAGFVASLAKPGGNITGFSVLSGDLDGKRQEILIEAVPGVHRMAALADVNFTPPAATPSVAGRSTFTWS